MNEEEARSVRRICFLYMSCKTPQAIAKIFMDDGIKSSMGKDKWQFSTILSILQNEKYKGDALVQKTYVLDFKTHKPKKNNVQMQQYYQENYHETIAPPHELFLAKVEMKRRKGLGYKYNCTNFFTCKLICSECGDFYGAKVWNSNDKYRKVVFQCNYKFTEETKYYIEKNYGNLDNLLKIQIESTINLLKNS